MQLALKIDIDTEVGTRIGVPNLVRVLKQFNIPATFYASLGPDHTGRAIKRIFRPGFLKKVLRTNVVNNYGIRTLLNGTLLSGPHIGRKHTAILRSLADDGFDVGIHSYDHQNWQDNVHKMSLKAFEEEFDRAQNEFMRIFGRPAQTAAAPGWQADAKVFCVYKQFGIQYSSDSRGETPFYPLVDNKIIRVIQVPTTLPTLDELLGQPGFVLADLTQHYLALMNKQRYNILTLHPELEGMHYLPWFQNFIATCVARNVKFTTLKNIADAPVLPLNQFVQQPFPGRSGLLLQQQPYQL